MSFVEAFYSFRIEISDSARNVYESVRLKTPRHPYESLQLLYARMLAFCHCYRKGQHFAAHLLDPKEATISQQDAIGETTLWVEVGQTDRKKLERALRAWPGAEFRIYFYAAEQIDQFAALLKGSKSDWISDIRFFVIDAELIENLIPLEKSSSDWDLTIVDHALYLTVDMHEFTSTIDSVDMWAAFQSHIGNPSTSER